MATIVDKNKGKVGKDGKPKSPLYYVVFIDPNTGKQKWVIAGKTKTSAREKKINVEKELLDGTYQSLKKTTFEEYCSSWLRNKKPYIKQATFDSYEVQIKYLNEHFGKRKLNEITNQAIRAYIAEKVEEGKLSNRSINYRLTMLKMIFEQAIDDGFIKINPTRRIKQLQKQSKETNILTPLELRKLLNVCEQPFKTLLMIAINTGMRIGEIRALKWLDIDTTNRIIKVQRNLYKNKEQTPKANKSRIVPINDALLNALLDYQISEHARASEAGWVFCTSKGTPYNDRNIAQRWFEKAIKHAGITKKVTFHSLRHSFCTLSADINNNQYKTQQLAGHSDISTTASYYVHLENKSLLEAANQIGNAITNAE